MFTNQIDSAKKFVKDHQLAITSPVIAVASFAVARNLKVSGVNESLETLRNMVNSDAETFRHFLVKTDQIDAFNTYLANRI